MRLIDLHLVGECVQTINGKKYIEWDILNSLPTADAVEITKKDISELIVILKYAKEAQEGRRQVIMTTTAETLRKELVVEALLTKWFDAFVPKTGR